MGSDILARMRGLSLLFSLTLALAACDDTSTPDAGMDAGGMFDAGLHPDAGLPDAGNQDAGPADAGVQDAGPADAGDQDGGAVERAGIIEGPCGVLDDELVDTSMSFVVRNSMRFDAPWSAEDDALVSEGAREILMDGTAGGSSGYSEAFAFEVLHRCEGAELIKSETEIVYDPVAGRTDMLAELDGLKIGVSVTRAFTFVSECTRGDAYTEAAAASLLMDKLESIAESSMNVSAEDAWVKQILFVFADTATHADVFQSVWDGLDPVERGDTILFLSVSEGEDTFLYFEDRCS